MRSIGKRSNNPAATMLFAPPPPSSAGWKTSWTGAGPVLVSLQQGGGSEQGGGVAVVAAGVHDAGVGRGVRDAAGFQDRQRVHVGAQADGAVGLSPANRGDHAVAADAGDERNAEFG